MSLAPASPAPPAPSSPQQDGSDGDKLKHNSWFARNREREQSSSLLEGKSSLQGNPVPRWLPLSLLALTTAALAVPIVLLRRSRNNTNVLSRTLNNPPPPPRRSSGTTLSAPPIRIPTSSSRPASIPSTRTPTSSGTFNSSNISKAVNEEVEKPSQPIDDFNGALYSAKAFGIATVLVTVGATATILGVKTAMGVRDTEEFAHRMRDAVLRRMPLLSSRIHRPPDPEDHGLDSDSPSLQLEAGAGVPWTWPAAEERLSAAFERDGFSGWVEAAMRELEAEGQLERIKRDHT